MATAAQCKAFLDKIAPIIVRMARENGFKVASPIIAQACLESGWGLSTLAAKHHNYFGMKCGSSWTGASVNMATKEEYQPGTLTDIKANFRAYSSMEEGVAGYFQFVSMPRYKNLKTAASAYAYLQLAKEAGYATSVNYVGNCMNVVKNYDLEKYDAEVINTQPVKVVDNLRLKVVNTAKGWIGVSEKNNGHKAIIDTYNDHKPLARGYAVQYTDAWCATTVSAVAIVCGCTDVMPTECSCGRMVELYQKLGRWEENDGYRPTPGDVIFYDWQDSGSGDCTGWPDHVGIVEAVDGDKITVIEGNYNGGVGRRVIAVNGKYIRGYGLPDLGPGIEQPAPAPAPAPQPEAPAPKVPQYQVGKSYTIQATELNVRTGPGTGYKKKLHKQLTKDGQKHDANKNGALDKGTVVTCLELKTVGGNVWMRVPSGWCAAYYNGNTYIS